MRISPIAIIALALAFVALVVAIGTEEEILPFMVMLAAAAALVAIATLFQYTRPSADVARVPIEDFSLWMDVGEPAAELRRLGPQEIDSAIQIAGADMGSLASNAELLSERLSLLVGKHGFDELTREKSHRHAYNLAADLRAVVKKLGLRESWSGEGIQQVLEGLEGCAAQADRIANKLYDFQREKPEIVRAYTEPLRRAAEKLSRDLRLVATNLGNYITRSAVTPQAGS